MKRKYRRINKRIFKRLQTSIPVTLKFLGLSCSHWPLRAETQDISLEGLSIELEAILKDGISLISNGHKRIRLIPFLVLNEKLVDLEITIPPEGLRIGATGRIVWYDFSFRDHAHYFRAGIFLEEMKTEDRKRWKDFLRTTV